MLFITIARFVQVDFTEPRIITGVVTKGISSAKTGDAWVEAYKIVYSNDLTNWNKILDAGSDEKVHGEFIRCHLQP